MESDRGYLAHTHTEVLEQATSSSDGRVETVLLNLTVTRL
jgi:hypothetical protein